MTAPDLICYAQALVDEKPLPDAGHDKRCAVDPICPAGVGAIGARTDGVLARSRAAEKGRRRGDVEVDEQIPAVNEVRHEPLITWDQDEALASVALRILRHLAHSVTKTGYPDRGRVRRSEHLSATRPHARPPGSLPLTRRHRLRRLQPNAADTSVEVAGVSLIAVPKRNALRVSTSAPSGAVRPFGGAPRAVAQSHSCMYNRRITRVGGGRAIPTELAGKGLALGAPRFLARHASRVKWCWSATWRCCLPVLAVGPPAVGGG